MTSHMRWSSSDANVATITNTGLVTAVGVGTVTITAISGPFHATTQLTVTSAAITLNSVAVTPATPSIHKRRLQPFIASRDYRDSRTANITTSLIWSASNARV